MQQVEPLAGFKILRPVLPAELDTNPQIKRWLYESMQGDPLSAGIDILFDDIYARHSIIWTWDSGILITSLHKLDKCQVLLVTNVRGKDFLANLAAIDHDVESHAKALGAEFILGDTPHPGLIKHYLRRGGQLWARVLRKVN